MTNTEVNLWAGMESFVCLFTQRQLRWVSHVIRMSEQRLPRQIFYGELADGGRHRGGSRKRYKDHIKATVKNCDIEPSNLETLAADRVQWRSVCGAGLEAYQNGINKTAEARWERHHQVTSPINIYPCKTCGKLCGSRIGLHSHRRTH